MEANALHKQRNAIRLKRADHASQVSKADIDMPYALHLRLYHNYDYAYIHVLRAV